MPGEAICPVCWHGGTTKTMNSHEKKGADMKISSSREIFVCILVYIKKHQRQAQAVHVQKHGEGGYLNRHVAQKTNGPKVWTLLES